MSFLPLLFGMYPILGAVCPPKDVESFGVWQIFSCSLFVPYFRHSTLFVPYFRHSTLVPYFRHFRHSVVPQYVPYFRRSFIAERHSVSRSVTSERHSVVFRGHTAPSKPRKDILHSKSTNRKPQIYSLRLKFAAAVFEIRILWCILTLRTYNKSDRIYPNGYNGHEIYIRIRYIHTYIYNLFSICIHKSIH